MVGSTRPPFRPPMVSGSSGVMTRAFSCLAATAGGSRALVAEGPSAFPVGSTGCAVEEPLRLQGRIDRAHLERLGRDRPMQRVTARTYPAPDAKRLALRPNVLSPTGMPTSILRIVGVAGNLWRPHSRMKRS
jgi:hypothetical protein